MNALEQFQTHRTNLDKELKEFVNGMNTPTIKALADKIENMCLYVGDPLSVTNMLQSICNNVIKKWGGEYGTKKIGICDEKQAYRENKQNPNIIIGHFRWDYGKGYILTANEIEYVKMFYFNGKFISPSFDKSNEYHISAVNFIKKHNVEFKIKLLKKAKYFSGDKEERNIYEIILIRNKNKYTFTFGQSINGTKNNETPSVYDVLTCLTKYDIGTFEDFCNEFGYEEDSRTAEKTYIAVCDEFKNVNMLFHDVMEELQEIQ